MSKIKKDIYELIENDNNEIMAIIFAQDTEPHNPCFLLHEVKHYIELYRNSKNTLILKGIKDEAIEKLKSVKKLYICEMYYNETIKENRIIYAYEAPLYNKEEYQRQLIETKQKAEISEKAKILKEKISNKHHS